MYIELTSNSDWSEEIIIEVYDNAGRLVGIATSLVNNNTKTMISLSGLESEYITLNAITKHLTIISKLLNSKIILKIGVLSQNKMKNFIH